MAIATFDDYRSKLELSVRRIDLAKFYGSGTSARYNDMWLANALAGSAPSTAVVPARDAVGAFGQVDGAGTALRCLGAEMSGMFGSTQVAVLCDRLSHQGGLSGTVDTAQTTNLPTAALTRYTDGVGVWCMLSIYSAVGSTATTVTMSYTNQAGTAGRTSPARPFGGSANSIAIRAVLMPLDQGDTGVRSVESVTLAATTGTAGNFGVTLFRPLVAFFNLAGGAQEGMSLVGGNMSGGLPEILDDACLFLLAMTSTGAIPAFGSIFLSED